MKRSYCVDTLRSRTMRAVKATNTKPELLVRRTVFRMGFRYRLHRTNLPGKPDLAFIAKRKIIFVHGCFWHGHHCARGARTPKTNKTYWINKIQRNQLRDKANISTLRKLGWKTFVIWECQLTKQSMLQSAIHQFLR